MGDRVRDLKSDGREATLMSNEDVNVKTAASNLTNAMSGLVRAIDAVKDDREAAKDIPEDLVAEIERLVARLNAARGFGN
jgi:hypothetical protein